MNEINPDRLLPELTASPELLSAAKAILQQNDKDPSKDALLMLPCVTDPRNIVIIHNFPLLGQLDIEVRTALSEAPTNKEVYTRTCMLDAATGDVQEYNEGTQGGVFSEVVISKNDPKALRPIVLREAEEFALLEQKLNRFSPAEEKTILGYLDQV